MAERPTDFDEHIAEVETRIDSAEQLAVQALLDEVDTTESLQGVVLLMQHAKLHLKAATK
jgi:hypothetical protein